MFADGTPKPHLQTERQLGLDGLRAMAVAAVLLFHLQMGYAPGGFLGVSLFFTLSGYLITHLLLEEHRTSGTIALRHFWARRVRRLMPAALVALVGITVVALSSNIFQAATLRGDLWATLGYVANWRFMSASTSYADLFTSAPSPVLHFWSLAIEEQFYFIFPVIMIVLLARKNRSWILPAGLALLWVASTAVSVIGVADNVVYYGTHTRAAELLTGSLLALVWPLGSLGQGDSARRRKRLSSIAAVFALVGFIGLVILVETGDRWLYSGGFAAVSFVSTALIIGVQSPGPVRWLAERHVMVAIGRISYGLYLFHWPIFLIVNENRVGLSGAPLHALRLLLTVIAAALSARLVEDPIQRRKILVRERSWMAFFAGALVILVGVIVVLPQRTPNALAGLDAPDTIVEFGAGREQKNMRVVVLGSQPAAVIDVRRALGQIDGVEIFDAVDPTCPIWVDESAATGCPSLAENLLAADAAFNPDFVVVGFGQLERSIFDDDLSITVAESFERVDTYMDGVLSALGQRETLLLDYGNRDPLFGELDDAGMQRLTVTTLLRPTEEALTTAIQHIVEKFEGVDERRRLMVIGDSSSFGVSSAIDAVADDQFSVVWAGGRNCPLVPVAKIRWWAGAEFEMDACPTLSPEWRDLIDTFRPHQILIVVSVPEQAEQQYEGDTNWYVLGDETFSQAHDIFMGEFMSLLEERDIELFIFSSPFIHRGALAGAQFSQDDRVDAWNAVIQSWAKTWPQISIIDWAGIIERLESEAGSLRDDGVHLTQSALNRIIASQVLPILQSGARSLIRDSID